MSGWNRSSSCTFAQPSGPPNCSRSAWSGVPGVMSEISTTQWWMSRSTQSARIPAKPSARSRMRATSSLHRMRVASADEKICDAAPRLPVCLSPLSPRRFGSFDSAGSGAAAAGAAATRPAPTASTCTCSSRERAPTRPAWRSRSGSCTRRLTWAATSSRSLRASTRARARWTPSSPISSRASTASSTAATWCRRYSRRGM
mmetsp:Transcript_11325/g.37454  ORF Transcript_11325/g.37454 Transcript_11325/m.37454 type:complete len:201 (+) Transcript_11325:857-1459(+)